MAERNGESMLRSFARKQAQQFNASPVSQAMNRDLTRNFNAVAEALMVPGKAARGDYNDLTIYSDGSVSPVSEALIGDAAKLAGMVSLGSMPMPRPTASLGMGGANFDRWFGGSKIVNPDGSPTTVYHGTGSDIPAFDRNNPRMRSGKLGMGIYVTPDPKKASFFADIRAKDGSPNVMPLYANLKNPYYIDGEMRLPVTGVDRGKLELAGYDGVVLRDEGGSIVKEIVVFDPTSLKSSIGNSGAFDPADPNLVRASSLPVFPLQESEE